jgi:release factor glutamine methyltransferase
MSLSTSVPYPGRAAVIARLRAAGCVFAEDEAHLLIECASTPTELSVLVERRAAGFPLEHVVGWAEFCGLRIAVDPGVFVPRRRTESLAQRAAALAGAGSVIVDLACGSGAIALAVAVLSGQVATACAGGADVEVHAADIDPAAVRCAQRNLAPIGGQVHAGDLYDPLPPRLRGHVDVLVANVPYVPTDAVDLLPPEARLYEPMVALDGGADGLDVIRRVAAPALGWLAPGGHLLLETSADQAGAAAAVLAATGLTPTVAHDHDREATVVIGTR